MKRILLMILSFISGFACALAAVRVVFTSAFGREPIMVPVRRKYKYIDKKKAIEDLKKLPLTFFTVGKEKE